MSLRENNKICNFEINHEEISQACIRIYKKDGIVDTSRCLKILEDNFTNLSPNIYLKERNGEDSWTPLMYCCWFEFYEGVKLLLSKGADPNMEGKDGKTCLSISSIKNKVNISQLLIKKGALVDKQDKQGKTALMNACEQGNIEQIKLLVENKANIKEKNHNNQDCIQIVMEKKKYNIVKFLEHFYLNSTLNVKDKAKLKTKI